MDGSIIGSVIGVVFLTIVNVAVVSYTYGKLSQKVVELCRRVERMENRLNEEDARDKWP